MLNPNFLIKKLEANNVDIDLSALMNEEKPKSTSDLRALSDFLELPEDTFYLPTLHPNKEIVVKRYSETDSYLYDEELIDYKITQLAKSPYMPECNGFNIQILANDQIMLAYLSQLSIPLSTTTQIIQFIYFGSTSKN